MYLIVNVLNTKFYELQNQLQNFEEESIKSANVDNIFNSVRELLNLQQFTYYDPKLCLFKDFQERPLDYEQMGLSGIFTYSETIKTLQSHLSLDYINEWAQETINRLQSGFPDVDQFFYNQKIHYFDTYQLQLDEISQISSTLTNDDSAIDIYYKLNYMYFTINNEQYLDEGVPFTNPMIFSRFSKDTVYIFDNFEEIDILNTTILETSSLVDRVWIFVIIHNSQVNVIEQLFHKKYLSLVQVMILQQNIAEFIKQNVVYENTVNNFQFVHEIQNEIEDQNKGQTYKTQNGTDKVVSTSYAIFFLFTKYCNYMSSGLQSSQNRIVILVSKEKCNYFMQRFNQNIQLFLSYSNDTQYRSSSLKSIIQYLNQLFYDETPKFGNVNNTMVFIKPVYIDSIYVGSVYRLIETTEFLAFSMFGVDKVSRTIILDTKTQRTLVDLFAQYSSPVINTSGNVQSFYSYQPVIFNQLDINTNHSDYIQVAKQQVFNIIDSEVFMITDSVKYQKQFKFKEYTAINALSSTFLGSQQLLPAVTCDQSSQEYIEQFDLFNNYISNTQLNFTALRSLASPSHTQIDEVCSGQNQSMCINSNSKFLNYQKLMKEKFTNQNNNPRCKIEKQLKFKIHSYQELLLKQYKNLKNIGNISYFISQMEQLIYLISVNKADEGFQLPLIQKVVEYVAYSTYIQRDMIYRYQLFKVYDQFIVNVMYDEILSDDTIVVIPSMVLDLFQEQQNILMFAAVTNNLQYVVKQQEVYEVVISSINTDNSKSQYRSLYDNQYDQYIASQYNEQPTEIQQIIMERINLYKYTTEVHQLHYFSFSSGDNWELIMREQLKAQPTALTEKFRVGQINGKLSVTKALTVQSKTLDNQTTVSGFLTVVLNQPYQFPIDEPYTLFDSNMRFIAGAADQQYQNGVKQILFKHNYVNNIHVNYTLGNIQNILELNNSFWTDAFEQSKQKKYTIVVTQNISTYQNRVSESDYNKSEVHQRSVIFDASCDYFVSGQIIVKQLGAIDGVLVIYKDVVLSNYSKDPELIGETVLTVDKISYYYGNLNSRQQSTTYSTKYKFNSSKHNLIPSLSKGEITVIIYQICIPVILIMILLVYYTSLEKPSLDYYTEKEQTSTTITESKIFKPRTIKNHVCLIQSIRSEVFYNISSTEQNTRQPQIYNYIFANDLQKYQILQNMTTHEQIYQYLLKQSEPTEQPNHFSFQILVSSQQYSIVMNNIMRSSSWLSTQSIVYTGSLQVEYKVDVWMHNSKKLSRISSKEISSSNLLERHQEPSENQNEQDTETYVSKVFDDSNLFMDRKLNSPCKVYMFKFRSNAIKLHTHVNDLIEESFHILESE
ncbi:Conserved_hypothetical protein [Hexamita inflata]|uniref:Transmembrane protein n=1 Tax=Hexamita inflata TaxID=28002 RepID=A0AA86PIE4_9EUKA|nr:Conserved hypothetical protein [Hexamita inflata]